jgi:hypothetical protein
MHREIAVFVLCIAVSFGCGWFVNGWRLGEEIANIHADYDKKRADAESQARAKEQEWSDNAAQIMRDKDAQNAATTRKLNNTIAGLRIRPERPSGAVSQTPGSCVGLSGAELARGDGEFLAGYAADAARLEAALKQCEAQYNSLRN